MIIVKDVDTLQKTDTPEEEIDQELNVSLNPETEGKLDIEDRMHSKKSSKTHTRSHTPVDPIVVDEAELKRIEDYLENVQVNTDTIEATEEELTRIEEFLKNSKLDSLPETMVKSGKKKGKSRHHTRANTQEAQSEIDAELDTLEFLLKTSNGPETLINTQKDTIGESNQLKLDSKKKAKNKKHSRDNTQEHRTEVTGIMDTKTVADAITDEAELSTSTDIKAPETKKKSSKTRSKTQEVAQADQLLTMNEFLENSNPELDTMSNHPIEVEDKKRSKPGSHKKKGKKSRNHTRSNTQETEQIANGDQLLTMKEFLENSKLDAKLETIDVPHISQSLDRQEDVPTKQTSIAKNKGKNKNHTRQNTLEHTLDNQPDSVEQLENLDQNHEKNPESIGNSTDMEDKSRKNNSPLQSAKQRKANSISESQMQNDLMEYEPEASEFSSPDLKEESSSIPQQTTKKSGKRKSRPGSFKIKTDTVDANQVDFNSPNPTVPETSSLADQNQVDQEFITNAESNIRVETLKLNNEGTFSQSTSKAVKPTYSNFAESVKTKPNMASSKKESTVKEGGTVSYASALKRMIPELVQEPKEITAENSPKQNNNSNEAQSSVRLKSILKKPLSRDGNAPNAVLESDAISLADEAKESEYILRPSGKTEIIFDAYRTEPVIQTEEQTNTTIPMEEHVELNHSNSDNEINESAQEIAEQYDVLPPIPRAQTAQRSMRVEKMMVDSSIQTYESGQNVLLSNDSVQSANSGEAQNLETADNMPGDASVESRASSPSGYMIQYKLSNQKMHFDPGVYSDFKSIDSAKIWLKKKKSLQKRGRKSGGPTLQKNLSAIDEDFDSKKDTRISTSSRGSTSSKISSSNQSESDDESLRRQAVRQASLQTFTQIPILPEETNTLVFDASTQTERETPQPEKKVRISIQSPVQTRQEAPQRRSIIQVKEEKPSNYLDKYLSSKKKKTKTLLPELPRLFSPVKHRPISRSSSSRSSRSSSASSEKIDKSRKTKGKYSNVKPRTNSAYSKSNKQENEYQLDPYMPATWYLPFDYVVQPPNQISNAPTPHQNMYPLDPISPPVMSPNNQNNHYKKTNDSQIPKPLKKSKNKISPKHYPQNTQPLAPISMYSPSSEMGPLSYQPMSTQHLSQTIYNPSPSIYEPLKSTYPTNNYHFQQPQDPNYFMQYDYYPSQYYNPQTYYNYEYDGSKTYRSESDLAHDRPWH